MKGLRTGISLAIAMAVVGSQASAPTHQGMSPDAIRKALGAKANGAPASGVVTGSDGWLFFTGELRYLAAGPFWGDNAATATHFAGTAGKDPLAAILDFKAQLDKAGIDLLIVPVPGKAAIYPEKLVDGATVDASSRIDAAQGDFLKALSDKGIKTIDLTPIFLQAKKDHPDTILFTKQDTHWSGAGINLAADAIAEAVKAEPWYGAVNKSQFTSEATKITVNGDLATMLGASKPAAEAMDITSVKQGGAAPAATDRKSPLVLLGDSHNLIYSIGGDDMLATGAGLPENLSARIGFIPDVVAVRGSGATPARKNLAMRQDNLAGKKMVVWVFTSREFTEGSGWRNVPVIKY